MKTYKLIDFITGTVLVIFFTVAGILYNDDRFIYGYFITGGWQLISMFIHLALRDHYIRTSGRKIYEKILFWLLITGILTIPLFILYLYLLLFISPFLAVYYQLMSYDEYKLMARRAFIHLKN